MKEVEVVIVVKKKFPITTSLGEIERQLIRCGWKIVQVCGVKEV